MANCVSKLPDGLPHVDLAPTKARLESRKIRNKKLARGTKLVTPYMEPTYEPPYEAYDTSEDSEWSGDDLYKIVGFFEVPRLQGSS